LVNSTETTILAIVTYMIEYRLLALANIIFTIVILGLLVRKYSERVRKVMHVYFAILTFYMPFLLLRYLNTVTKDVNTLQNRAFQLVGLRELPPGMVVEGVTIPRWLFWGFSIIFFVATIVTVVFWLIDIKKRNTVYDYTKMPRWQKILTLFLAFYALTYFHSFLFGVYFAMVAGVPIPLFSQYGLWSCPVNLLFVAILTPLVPKVNKPLYISVCLNSIIAPILQQGIAPIAVNLDALSVLPAGLYGLFMLWRTTRKMESKRVTISSSTE
jgi:hypothetical protein